MSPSESKSGTAAFRVRMFGMAVIIYFLSYFVSLLYNALVNLEVISFRYSDIWKEYIV